MGIYASSGRSRNPFGFLATLVGLVGAVCSLVLWTYQLNPSSNVIRSFSARLGPGGLLGDRLSLVAVVCGALAIGMAIVFSMGGKMRASTGVAIALGVLAVSYPALSALKVVARPFSHGSIP